MCVNIRFLVLLLIVGSAIAFSGTALDEYVNYDDGAFQYSVVSTTAASAYSVYIIKMTSQKWQTPEFSNRHIWNHTVAVCVPNTVVVPSGFLYIDGGNESSTPSLDFIVPICSLGAIAASIRQVPNQPLSFPDSAPLTEDAIIAHTFRSFMNGTGENPSQLLLFPMVKAAKRALDTVQDFARNRIPGRSINVPTFTVAGASKRGWTTWLLTAVDERVTASVPIVLALLNMDVNIPDEWRSLGEWGFALDDYTHQQVFEFIGTPMFDLLKRHVDPISYNDRYARLPKLVLDSSLDQFFLLDSPKYFYSQLKGPKYLVVLPNSDHSFAVPGSVTQALQIIAYFFLSVSTGTKLPEMSWSLKYSNTSDVIPEIVVSSPNANQIVSVSKWSITTTRPGFRDFRLNTCIDLTNPACFNYVANGVQWVSTPLTASSVNGNTATYTANVTNLVVAPQVTSQRWTGFLVQVTFLVSLPGGQSVPFVLTSEPNIFPDFYPFPAHVRDYASIGYCKLGYTQNKASSWNDGTKDYTQWTVSFSTSHDVYAAQIQLDKPIVSLYGLNSINGNLYSIPTYQYVNGKIPAGTTVSFGYTIASKEKAAIKFANNACYPSYSADCTVSVSPSVTGQWKQDNKNYQSVNLNVKNTGAKTVPNTEVTINLENGSYLSQTWNLQQKVGFPNTYICPLYNLAPGQTSSACGYIVVYNTKPATVSSTLTYCL